MARATLAVDLPSANPAQVGSLELSALRPPADIDPHWVNGVSWKPYACDGGRILDSCDPAADTEGANLDATAVALAIPFVVETGAICTTLVGADEKYGQQAVDQLLAIRSARIEAEFERGTLSSAETYGNFFLTDDPDDLAVIRGDSAATAYGVVQGFGGLEQETMQALGGRRCAIHVPIYLVAFLADKNLIYRDGNYLLTNLGNIVIAGAGYEGASPDNVEDNSEDTTWIYGTDIPRLWLGDVNVSVLEDSIDRSTNTAEVRASQFAAVTVNPCVDIAAKITTT